MIGFGFTDEQWKEIERWQEEHSRVKHKIKERNYPVKYCPEAASYVYEFIDTHLGTLGSVRCETCGKKVRKYSREEVDNRQIDPKGTTFFVGEVSRVKL